MSNALVLKNDIALNSISEVERFANNAVKSGLYKDVKDAASAVVRIMIGREVGLGAAASWKNIQIVQGTPTFSANLVASMIKKSRPRYNYRPKVLSEKECTLMFFEDGEECGTWTYTIEDARKAGLTSKDNWVKYPKSMLFARCITAGGRAFCPDVSVFPLYTSEELGGAVSDEDVFDDEREEKTFVPSSEVSVEDRYKLLSMCAERGIAVPKLCKNLGIQSIESITEPEFKRAIQFVNSSKGE